MHGIMPTNEYAKHLMLAKLNDSWVCCEVHCKLCEWVDGSTSQRHIANTQQSCTKDRCYIMLGCRQLQLYSSESSHDHKHHTQHHKHQASKSGMQFTIVKHKPQAENCSTLNPHCTQYVTLLEVHREKASVHYQGIAFKTPY